MSKESALAMATNLAAGPSGQLAITTTSSSSGGTQTIAPIIPQESKPETSPELKSTPFSHLAKKEAEFVKLRTEFKKEQEVWNKEKEVLIKAKAQYDEYLQKKESDPISALKILGFSESDILNYLAAQEKPELTPEQKAAQAAAQAADEKIKAFEENQKKKEQDAEKQRDEAIVNNFKADLGKIVETDKTKYEFCSFYGKEAEDLAYDLTISILKESKGQDLITAKEAMDLVEEFYEERDTQMDSLNKRKTKAQPQVTASATPQTAMRTRTLAPQPASNSDSVPKPPISRIRTALSNTTNSTLASARMVRNETREEKRARLIEALRNGTQL